MQIGDLTTLANLKQWLPINSGTTSDDTTIGRLITAVSCDFARATRRPDLLSANYVKEARQGDGGTRMIVYHWPILTVSAVTVGGVAIPESSDKIQPGWYFDDGADIDPERAWNIYLNGYCFTDGAAVVLNYEGGYQAPPEDVEQAVIDWCAYRYKNRPNVSTTQRRSSEGDSTQSELIDAPPNVLSVIERYMRQVPSVDRRGDEREERQAGAHARAGRGRK